MLTAKWSESGIIGICRAYCNSSGLSCSLRGSRAASDSIAYPSVEVGYESSKLVVPTRSNTGLLTSLGFIQTASFRPATSATPEVRIMAKSVADSL